MSLVKSRKDRRQVKRLKRIIPFAKPRVRTIEDIVNEAYQRIEPRLDSVIRGFEGSEIVRMRMAAEAFKARRNLVKEAVRDAINEYVSVGNARDMKEVLRSMLAVK